jgi:hypothetical protein
MTYRLLIDYEALDVLDVLASLKKPVQRLVHQRLRQIQEFPSQWADYQERDPADALCMSASSTTTPSPTGKTLPTVM